MSHEMKIPKRGEQNPADCWAVEDLYPSDEAWTAEFESCQSFVDEMAAFKGRLGESAQTLFNFLTRYEQGIQTVEKLYVYTFMKSDEDTANSNYLAMKGRCFSFIVKLNGATSFEQPELVALGQDMLDGFYAELPELEKYRRYITRSRLNKDHILSPAEENLLSAAGTPASGPSNIFGAFVYADMKFPSVADSEGKQYTLSNGSYGSLLESDDRTLRENAFKALYGVYGDSKNMFAATLDAEVSKCVFFAKARKYESSLQSALMPVEVSEVVYHNLIESVHQNLDKMYRYMDLRRKAMGLDELHMYDIYASMLPEADQTISFEQARQDVLASTKVLGKEYSEVLARSFEERWMDIYENEGKRSGAYSIGSPLHPFVLLNHKDNLDTEFTLAHEMGHAMHSYLSNKHQSPIDADYVIFVAEVASTCNEALLMQYLLGKTTDKKQRAILINYFLEQFRTTLYRQTMFAEFELKIHQISETGETLTAEQLCEIYLELNKLYYGDGIVSDPEIAMEWSRIPHFYRHFYVYQYATGFSAAMALSARILREGEPAVQDYLKFLSGGCSTDPISLLKIAGVDISTPEPVNAALNLFGELIDELAGLLED